MSIENITRCDADGCDQVKAEGNRWWTITRLRTSIVVAPHREDRASGEPMDKGSVLLDGCGDDHLLKILGREAAALMEASNG